MKPRHSKSNSITFALRISWFLMMMFGVMACEDPNKMFEGVWVSTDDAYDELEGALVGAPTLALGHYGRDLTGLVYFHEALGSSSFEQGCPNVKPLVGET